MFKITLSPSYFAKVTVQLAGVKNPSVFEVEFTRLSSTALTDLTERVKDGKLDDAPFCREVVVGWKGVSDEEGELEFSPAALDQLLDIYPVAASIVQAFYGSLAGVSLKN